MKKKGYTERRTPAHRALDAWHLSMARSRPVSLEACLRAVRVRFAPFPRRVLP